MSKFFSNFWVCCAFALWCAWLAAGSAQRGDIGWAWLLGFFALVWLNDARRALNRDKEVSDGREGGTPEG